jgi:hypothetical protein
LGKKQPGSALAAEQKYGWCSKAARLPSRLHCLTEQGHGQAGTPPPKPVNFSRKFRRESFLLNSKDFAAHSKFSLSRRRYQEKLRVGIEDFFNHSRQDVCTLKHRPPSMAIHLTEVESL